MTPESVLQDKLILVVDDEPDVVESVEEEIPMCTVHKAGDYRSGHQRLLSYTYDAVILDIMGVRGFDLLRTAVKRGFPTVMLTAHSLTPEALKKSMKLGAVSFLPKEKISELIEVVSIAIRGGTRPSWIRFFDAFGGFFNRRFGVGWKERDRYFQEFEEAVRNPKGT
jgi:DNA-binding response OmpR family regulator